MQTLIRSIGLATLFAASSAFAQTQSDTTTTPVGNLNLGEEVGENGAPAQDPNGPGSVYLKQEEGDWEVRCQRVADSGVEPCNLYQLLKDGQGNSVAEITIFALPEGNQAAAGAQVITPLETLLTQQITIRVDGGTAKRYPFSFCTTVGCFAQIGFTAADVASFRAGNVATVTISPAGAASGTTVDLSASLKGFTAGYKAVQDATNAAAAARAQ